MTPIIVGFYQTTARNYTGDPAIDRSPANELFEQGEIFYIDGRRREHTNKPEKNTRKDYILEPLFADQATRYIREIPQSIFKRVHQGELKKILEKQKRTINPRLEALVENYQHSSAQE